MAKTLKLPVGIDSFEKIRKNEYYYVDKTRLIEQLVESGSEVTLFTRPRRFGKTLNMSMLKSFFETDADATLFEGLYISNNKEICEQYMGKHPVLFLSLKSVDGLTFENAKYRITELIGLEAQRFSFLATSEKLSDNEKEQYHAIIALQQGQYSMDEKLLISSIFLMSHLLSRHFGQKTIILIDEYDVPLDKAFQNGYYRDMVALLRGLFGMALKTNDSLQFAVLTGCLRISKESIFTGLNNFKVLSILDSRFDEQFGFTDSEVKKILEDYHLSSHLDVVKEWYDGYHFGNADIYCPWDVINYADQLRYDPTIPPRDFWSNSSGNAIVRRFIDKADMSTRNEIEDLIAGEWIEKDIVPELTYDEIDKSIDNLWSVLFTTGYLTHQGCTENGRYRLVIPNREIRNLFVKKIREWFADVSRSDGTTLEELSTALVNKESEKIERIFGNYLWNTISIRDNAVAKERQENFYHGILLGLLAYKSDWLIKSNAESGIGYSDILIEVPDNRTGIVIELKYAKNGDMEAACQEALKQIEEKDYIARLKQDGMKNFIRYGIACFKKDCRVVVD